MVKILSTEQIRRADAHTIAHEPIPSIDLMERAARQLFNWIRSYYDPSRPFRIFAGHGNNGGDGLALARMLSEAGYRVSLHLAMPPDQLSPDARVNFDRLNRADLLECSCSGDASAIPLFRPDEVVVDALLGTGLTREPDGVYARLIDLVNSCGAEVISVDIPSGLFGEDNRLNSMKHVVRARYTLSFELPKLAFFFSENHPFTGDWRILPIGLSHDFIREAETPFHMITQRDVASWLPSRSRFTHKGHYGHLLLVAGSKGKTGAAVLAARAALRAGAGLVTVHAPSSASGVLHTAIPEAMASIDSDEAIWTQVPDPAPYDAMGIGPGIGTHPNTAKAFFALLDTCTKPLVIDADALNLLSLHPGSILKVPENSILTPHPGEFVRLFGEDPDEYSRMERIGQLAKKYRLVIVLKGAFTLVANPGGEIWFNTNGNPGMATGGSGDVLTGLIASLAGQGLGAAEATVAGVYIHGLAGDLARDEEGESGLMAGDIAAHVGQAIKSIKS